MRAALSKALRQVLTAEFVTPSQLKKLAAKDWFEVEARHDSSVGEPWIGTYELILPNGEKRVGALG